jgi:hypothetical protein
MKTAIAYTRVSTAQQGKSGLGMEAQLRARVDVSFLVNATCSRYPR